MYLKHRSRGSLLIQFCPAPVGLELLISHTAAQPCPTTCHETTVLLGLLSSSFLCSLFCCGISHNDSEKQINKYSSIVMTRSLHAFVLLVTLTDVSSKSSALRPSPYISTKGKAVVTSRVSGRGNRIGPVFPPFRPSVTRSGGTPPHTHNLKYIL